MTASAATGGDLVTTVVPVTAGDGRAINVHHVTGPVAPAKGPVLLVHGAGVRANIFRPPGQTTLVDLLVAAWLRRVARELAGQHRPRAQRVGPRPGRGL